MSFFMEIIRENISQIGLNIESVKDIPFESMKKTSHLLLMGWNIKQAELLQIFYHLEFVIIISLMRQLINFT